MPDKVSAAAILTDRRVGGEWTDLLDRTLAGHEEVAAVKLRIEAGAEVYFAEIAAPLGYADQSHLTRDFKATTRMTPQELRRLVAADARGE